LDEDATGTEPPTVVGYYSVLSSDPAARRRTCKRCWILLQRRSRRVIHSPSI